MRPSFIALLAALASGACGDASSSTAPPDFGHDPYAVVPSDGGQLRIAVTTSPQPPERGTNTVQLRVTTTTGAPVPALAIDAVPWMPAMGHGASVEPHVEDRGDGVYVVHDVDTFMPGRWELRLSFSGSVTDHATPTLDIP